MTEITGRVGPALEARDARISVDGAVLVERLSLVSAGDRVVIAGETGPLFGALTGIPRSAMRAPRGRSPVPVDADQQGEAFVVGGALLLGGASVAAGEHVGLAGIAGLDLPLPPDWTAEAYVTWGARIAGATRRDARGLAAVALERAGLGQHRKKLAAALSTAQRRALGIASAVATAAEIVVAEAPLSGLEGADAAFVRQALEAAVTGRRLVVSVERLDAASEEGALARSASYLAVISRGELALEGSPGELFSGARLYALTVRTHAEALREELAQRGIELRGGPTRFAATLPADARTRDILAAARASGAAVVEMMPILGESLIGGATSPSGGRPV